MKSPDEIKKGLECCSNDEERTKCVRCPYGDGTCREDLYAIEKDALALVQQLEAENDAMLETIKRMACCGADCGGCVHMTEEPDKHCVDLDFDCEHCLEKCACYSCKDGSKYEWRGVQLPPSSPDGESTSLGDGG